MQRVCSIIALCAMTTLYSISYREAYDAAMKLAYYTEDISYANTCNEDQRRSHAIYASSSQTEYELLSQLGECSGEYGCSLSRSLHPHIRNTFGSHVADELIQKWYTTQEPIYYMSFGSGFVLQDAAILAYTLLHCHDMHIVAHFVDFENTVLTKSSHTAMMSHEPSCNDIIPLYAVYHILQTAFPNACITCTAHASLDDYHAYMLEHNEPCPDVITGCDIGGNRIISSENTSLLSVSGVKPLKQPAIASIIAPSKELGPRMRWYSNREPYHPMECNINTDGYTHLVRNALIDYDLETFLHCAGSILYHKASTRVILLTKLGGPKMVDIHYGVEKQHDVTLNEFMRNIHTRKQGTTYPGTWCTITDACNMMS